MMMNILYIITGAIFKGYDDITDGKTEISPFFLEILKVLTTVFLTIAFLKSPELTFYFLITTLVCLVNKSADTDFWKAGAVIPFISILFHIPYFTSLSWIDFAIRILVAFIIVIILFVEHTLIPEDMSLQKYFSRILLFLTHTSISYISNIYEIHYLLPLSLFYAGYFGTNLVYHFPTFIGYFSISQTSVSPHENNSSISNTELKK